MPYSCGILVYRLVMSKVANIVYWLLNLEHLLRKSRHQSLILHPKILNLSSTKLTEIQIKVLNKGLKFTPTRRENSYELKADIETFTRKLRLIEYFHDKGSPDDEKSLVRNKSTFYPEHNRNRHLDIAIDYLNNANVSSHERRHKSNLSKQEWSAIRDLQNNSNIVIKEADKGGSVVIMEKDHYLKMVYDQLNDRATYKKGDSTHDKKVMTSLRKFVAKYDHVLTGKEKDYLVNFTPKTSNFYGLPKVHKSEIISEQIKIQNKEYITALRPEDLKLRPIVAGPKCPTKRLSTLLDIIIKPMIKHVKSYVRDKSYVRGFSQ